MNVRRTRKSCWLLTLLFLGGAACVVGAAYWRPVETPSEEPIDVAAPVPPPSAASDVLPAPNELQKTAAFDLRQRLFDPPPPPPPPPEVKKPVPPPNVKLIGTVTDSESPVAMIASPRGLIELKKTGDQVGDDSNPARITTIESNRVVLDHMGKSIELVIEQK